VHGECRDEPDAPRASGGTFLMKTIQLTRGQVALVDDDDFDEVAPFKWHAGKGGRTFYAVRGGAVKISMHRQLMGFPTLDIDHVNGCGTDNRRANMRLATRSQNLANQRPQEGRSSRHKGVHWHKEHRKWTAAFQFQNKRIKLGYFASEVGAAAAYERAARRLSGEFARVGTATTSLLFFLALCLSLPLLAEVTG
jgi:hypothetical protein